MKSKVFRRRYIKRARSLMAVLIVMLMTMASFPFMTAMDTADTDGDGSGKAPDVVITPDGKPVVTDGDDVDDDDVIDTGAPGDDESFIGGDDDDVDAEDDDADPCGCGECDDCLAAVDADACDCGECEDCLASAEVDVCDCGECEDCLAVEEEILPCECCSDDCECVDCDGTECGCCAGFALFGFSPLAWGDTNILNDPDDNLNAGQWNEAGINSNGQLQIKGVAGTYSNAKGENMVTSTTCHIYGFEVTVAPDVGATSGDIKFQTAFNVAAGWDAWEVDGASVHTVAWNATNMTVKKVNSTPAPIVPGQNAWGEFFIQSAGDSDNGDIDFYITEVWLLGSAGERLTDEPLYKYTVPTPPTCDHDIEITTMTGNGGTVIGNTFNGTATYGNAGAIFTVTIPTGRKLSDYESLSFDFTGVGGDLGWKDVRLYVMTASPTGWMEDQPFLKGRVEDPSSTVPLTFSFTDTFYHNPGGAGGAGETALPTAQVNATLALTGTVYFVYSHHSNPAEFKLENVILKCNGACTAPPCTEHIWEDEGTNRHKCSVCNISAACRDFVTGVTGKHNCGICARAYDCTYAANGICTVCGALDPNHAPPTLPADAFDLGAMDFRNNANQRGWNIGGAVFDAFKESEYFVFHIEASTMSALGGMGGLTIVLNGPSWTETKVLEPDWTNASDLLSLSWIELVDNEYVFTIELPSLNGYSAFIGNGGWELVISYYANTDFFDSISKAYLLPPPPGACTEHVWSSAGADAGKHKCTICGRQEDCLDFKAGATGKHNCTVCDKPYDCTWRSDGVCAVCGQKNPDHDDTEYEATIINLGKINVQNNDTQRGWTISGANIDNLSKATYFVFTLPASVIETWGGIGGTQFIFNPNSGGWHQTDVTPGWTGQNNILNMSMPSGIITVTFDNGKYHFSVDLALAVQYSNWIGQEGKLFLAHYDYENQGRPALFFNNVEAYLVIYEGAAPPPPCRHTYNHSHVCTVCGITHPSGTAHTYNLIDVCTICGYVNPDTTNICALQGHDYRPAGSDNGRWGHNCGRNCGALDWEDHSFDSSWRCTKCGYAGLVSCAAGNHQYQPAGSDNGRWGHNCGRHCGWMDWEEHTFNAQGVCTKCRYSLSAADLEEFLAGELEGEDDAEIEAEDNRDVGGLISDAEVIDEGYIRRILSNAIFEGNTPVLNLAEIIAETGGSVLTRDLFLLIRELGVDVRVDLPSGFSYTIIASSISDNVGDFDLNIQIYMTASDLTIDGQEFPSGSIVIKPNFVGFFGFDIKIHITAEQLAAAGIEADNVNLFHIDGDNKVTFIGPLRLNSDGSVDFTINSASYYKLSGVGLVTPMTVETRSYTGLIIALSVAAVLVIAGTIVIVTKMGKKRRESAGG